MGEQSGSGREREVERVIIRASEGTTLLLYDPKSILHNFINCVAESADPPSPFCDKRETCA